MDLGTKRLILVILSLAGGIGGLFLIFAVLNAVYHANVNLERYGYTYAVLTALPLALLVGVWLDYFLGTQLLPDEPKGKE
jgi:membrane protease YdiL (CAAX protease family)